MSVKFRETTIKLTCLFFISFIRKFNNIRCLLFDVQRKQRKCLPSHCIYQIGLILRKIKLIKNSFSKGRKKGYIFKDYKINVRMVSTCLITISKKLGIFFINNFPC